MTKSQMFIQWIVEKKQYFIIGTIMIGVIIYYFLNNEDNGLVEGQLFEIGTEENSIEESIQDSDEKKILQEPISIKVDIKGAIQTPGVFTSTEGERVIDIIERAGGLTDNADQSKVNLSQKVVDEMVIYIPKYGEDIEMLPTIVSQSTSNEEGKVNINSADSNTLQTLSGIGPSKAEAIIEYREQNGPFQKIEDIMNISGIGEKTYEKFKEDITVK